MRGISRKSFNALRERVAQLLAKTNGTVQTSELESLQEMIRDLTLGQDELEQRIESQNQTLIKAGERELRHINVLCAIHNVNQLFLQEEDHARFIQRACDNLIKDLSYHAAWIVLLDKSGHSVLATASAGLNGGFSKLQDQLLKGNFPACLNRSLESDGVTFMNDLNADCPGCPVVVECRGCAGMARRLEFDGTIHGILTVSLPVEFDESDQEEKLFREIADDLAFALQKLETAIHLRKNREMLERTEGIAHVGSWELDLFNDTVLWSKELFRIFGRDPSIGAPSFADHPNLFVPEDMQRLQQAVHRCVMDGTPYEMEARILRSDGEIRHCVTRGQAERDANGVIYRLVGSAQDITEHKRIEEEIERNGVRLAAIVDILQYHADTVQDFLDHALEKAIALTQSKLGYIYFYDEGSQEFILNSWSKDVMKECAILNRQTRYELGKTGIWGEAIRQRSPIIINDFHAENPQKKGYPEDHVQLKRFLTIPVFQRERIVAVVGVANKPSDYREADTQELTLLMDAVWKSVEAIRSEESLRREREHLAFVIDGSRLGTWEWKTQTDEITLNETWASMLGFSSSDPTTFNLEAWIGLIHPGDQSIASEQYLRCLKDEASDYECEFRMKRRDGTWIWTLSRGRTMTRSAEGHPLALYGTLNNITQKKQLEEELVRQKRRFEQILTQFPFGICIISGDHQIEYTNPILNKEFGDLGGRKCYEYFHDFSEPCTWCKNERILNGETVGWEWHLSKSNRDYALVDIPLHNEDGTISKLEVFRDITERKRAAEDLRASEERHRAIIDASPLAIIAHDGNGRVLSWNTAAKSIFGWSEEDVLGQAIPFVAESQKDKYRNLRNCVLMGDAFYQEELTCRRKDGAPINVSVSAAPIRDKDGRISTILGIYADITESMQAEAEREKLQSQLIQAQKLESVGRLAGGVAHDFNNMLSVILGYSELALDKVKTTDPLHTDLREIYGAAKRSAEITRQLLAFARRQTISPQTLDLNATVEAMLKMLRRLIGEDVDLIWKPSAALWAVRMDPSQIDQILANLCVNARDAIGGTGKISIETGNVRLDECGDPDGARVAPGDYVMLTVSDNGCGMNKEILNSLFDPFFTTKAAGKGTGLGMATVYGIVKQNNGTIDVFSEQDQGATFKIYLPRFEGDSDAVDSLARKEIPKGHGETVLIVEDEAIILKIAKGILEQLSYQVLGATSPGRAMDLAKAHTGKIHLLITDVVMPEMNGRVLAEKLTALHPELRVLFMSGYTADVIADRGVLEEGVSFIQKPFSRGDLGLKVRETLTK